jgi:hypothetical protein
MSEPLGLALIGLGFLLFVVMAVGFWIAPSGVVTRESPLNLKSRPVPPTPSEEPDVFKHIEALAAASHIEEEQAAKNRRWLRPIGFVTRLLTYAALFIILYLWAPKDISNTPMAGLTLSDIAGTAIFVGIAIVLIRALFEPSDDDKVKDAWGWFGVVLLTLFVLASIFLYKAP